MEELSSHGYVTVVISHPGVADAVYPDGRVLRRYPRLFDPKPEGWNRELDSNAAIGLTRAVYDRYYDEAAAYLAADVSFVIDRLEALNASRDTPGWAGWLDLGRIATLGHSYGGNVAVEAGARRCWHLRVI